MRQLRRGFSLIELLVVIGIIALLLAILLPVLNRVRRTARSTVCLAHLQQLGDCYHMYLNNNAGHSFSLPQDITGLSWWELLQPYNHSIKDTLLCPEATEPGNMIGGAFRAWGPERTYSVGAPQWIARDVWVGSFGMNEWIYRPRSEQRASLPESWRVHGIELPTRQPDRVPVFGDCMWGWATPEDTDTVPLSLIDPLPYNPGTGAKVPPGPRGMMAYFCLDRHYHAVNVAFLDGHAERTPLADLWKLRWNNAFQPRNVTVP